MKKIKNVPSGTKRRFFIVSIVLIVLLLIGNSVITRNQSSTTDAPSITPQLSVSVSAIENVLVTSYRFEKGEDATQPFVPIAGMSYVRDLELLQIYEFSSEADAVQTRETIGTDGYQIGEVIYEWLHPPHFYQQGNVIALYFGNDADVLGYLQENFGEPFVDRR